VHLSFVVSQVQFIVKDDKSRRQALHIVTHPVLPIKVFFQRRVIFEELVHDFLLFANVTFVVFLLQVHVQECQVVKAHGPAEFTDGVAPKTRGRAVARLQVFFQLVWFEPRQPADKIAFVIDAKLTKRQSMLVSQVIL
jgi:hypothetical protein